MAFEIEEHHIDVRDLRIGMYVCRLDRPWEGTPFPLQGLELQSKDDIDAISELCRHVYVDARRLVVRDALQIPRPLKRTALSRTRFQQRTHYGNEVQVEDEAPRARHALEQVSRIVDRLLDDVVRGENLSVERVEAAVRPLVASVLRNADAFFLVEGLRRHDSYSYSHSIGCSALAAAFGRHMGFAEETIISLAAGGLLMDVGKLRLPDALLRYPGPLSPLDADLVRAHVSHGIDVVTRAGITDADVLDIMHTHHERHDGSGYPRGLSGNAIPVAGRMLGIIDSYDAMISVRPYRPAVSRHHALRQIYASRNLQFQAELVEQFQVCLGVYPTGSMVELTSGEIAIVMAQNQVRRLRPRVAILTTPDKQPLAEFRQLDLLAQPDASPLEIVRNLVAGDYDIDAAHWFAS